MTMPFSTFHPLVGYLLLIVLMPLSLSAFAASPLDIVFTYGSEKDKWVQDVTALFNKSATKTTSGKVIQVKPMPMGSGETVRTALTGEVKAHLISPASSVFIELGNTESREKSGKDLVGETKNIVLSPVVIAMWKPMAEALGWGQRPIGWAEIHNMASQPEGWAVLEQPQWGEFRFGHTHPEYSNSGIIALLAQTYAAAGKKRGLTAADVANPDVRHYVEEIQKSIIHYGESTGFFGKKMFTNGPSYLSAAVLYENMVIESYDPKYQLPFPIVAIYPQEGTFWSDHPTGIVEREWVSPEHREAAQLYLDYLLARPQQEKALKYGFRPADIDIPLTTPLDADHGVDPKEPQTLLQVPPGPVVRDVLALWQERKKPANIVLVIDISGSMQGAKMNNAIKGALELVSVMRDADTLSLLAFNDKATWLLKDAPLKDKRAEAEKHIKSLFARGGTALYDAVSAAHQHLTANAQSGKIAAIVVLSDGEDTNSQLKLDALTAQIQLSETSQIRIFPIAYGFGTDKPQPALVKIADATQAQYYTGETDNIGKVFREIAIFF